MSYVNSVTVYPSSATITKGKWYYGAYASISSNCPECAEVEWYSNSPAIASVNKTTGYIYGVSTGTTRIYAEATDDSGKKDYITVTVTAPVPVTGVSVCPTSLTMNVGDTDFLCETIYPSNATNKTVTWCSSNENVACVNYYTGEITANMAGTTTITATTVDGGFQTCCEVTVRTPINGSIDVSTLTPVSGNRYLTQGEMENNALIIYDYLRNKVETPWSKNAICALLGNMQAESSINPGRWQSGVGPGYGLVQWDPASKWQNWAMANHYAEDSLFGQLCKILNEVAMDGVGVWDDNLHQWQNFRVNPEMSFRSFTTSNKSVDELSTVFLKCYERPADQSNSVIASRQELCSNWLTYLNSVFGS